MNDFEQHLAKTSEVGFVREVVGAIAYVSGLPTTRPGELVIFETGERGLIFTLGENMLEVLTFSKNPIKMGVRVARTDDFPKVPVGIELLSNVIDPFGDSFDQHKMFKKPTEKRQIQSDPAGIMSRKTIKKYFETGVSLVDLMVPLGRGQRQLVIGDRKTGKTNFLLQTIVSAAKQGDVCIYAAIGKNKTEIKSAEEYFEANKVLKNVIIMASASQDPPGIIYLTPYSAMTIAEYFRDLGRDVLLILDDLTTHAKYYREISLVGKGFPGRDSYPGDIFYVHARLLERAGNFWSKNGDVSITCLPVVETLQGDLSGYIQTNIMSMTDGHIYFDSNLFSQGRRPSINPFLSVTRVGRQTQSDSKRSINRELLTFLTLYDKMQNLVHFGSELNESIRVIIDTGDKIIQLFDQDTNKVIPSNVQAIVLSLLWGEDFKKLGFAELSDYKDKVSSLYQKDPQYRKMVDETVEKADSFNDILKVVRDGSARFQIGLPANQGIFQGNPTAVPTNANQAETQKPDAKGQVKSN